MGIILANHAMLLALWVVLIAIGLSVLMQLVCGMRTKGGATELASIVTRPMLFDIIPLIVLAWLTKADPTHIIMMVWYWVAALFIVVRAILEIVQALKK